MIRARLGGWPAAVLLLWLVAAIVLIVVMRDAIPGGWLKDTDDYMRLMEVRDWLAGQSWYDVSQHRLNPPEGAMMHWTRLVDLPLAAGFLLLTPLLGSVWAENVTMVAVPLLLLLATMITLGWMISRLVDAPGAAEIGPALMLFSPFTIMQFMPLRIDHHGWQILMAALASAALLADRRSRGGIIAGLALGFWLTVSLEGLPFAAICLGAVGLRWCFDSSEASRLASLAATLALSAAAFFLITIPPSAWGRTFCDATSAGQLGALATAAAGIAILTRLPLASTALPRMIGLALVAAASGGMLALVAPQCLSGPFSTCGTCMSAKGCRSGACRRISASSYCSCLRSPLPDRFGSARGRPTMRCGGDGRSSRCCWRAGPRWGCSCCAPAAWPRYWQCPAQSPWRAGFLSGFAPRKALRSASSEPPGRSCCPRRLRPPLR
jgi:hypothetical protein